MNTDIKLMITLAGNQRLPHLGADIFKDKELTCFYLRTLIKGFDGWDPILTNKDCIWAAYYYAVEVIKGRWPEAEHLIARNGDYWRAYEVFLTRFPLKLPL